MAVITGALTNARQHLDTAYYYPTGQWFTATPTYQIRYSTVIYPNMNYDVHSAYLQFNLGNLQYKNLTKVVLRQFVNAVTATPPYTVRLQLFTINDINRVNNFDFGAPGDVTIYGTVNSAVAAIPGTAYDIDITSVFDIAKAQNDRIGIKVNYVPGPYGAGLVFNNTASLVPYLEFTVDDIIPLAPTNLLPTATQNPKAAITLSWWHTPNPALTTDPQNQSQVEYWQGAGTHVTQTIAGTTNRYVLPANTFTTYTAVTFRARTSTTNNGWGPWTQNSFPLAATPPLASVLVYPVGASVSGDNGVMLEWRYNSPYDTTPSRFDIRYRVDGGAWVNRQTAGAVTVMTSPIFTQSTVDWQVMAYGALGDAGPWSSIATFFTIGVPPAPVIVSVTDSNRPTVFFSAASLLSWELLILRDGITEVYSTGNQAFMDEFFHTVNTILPNGNYIARMRITNQYGFSSPWAQLPFTLDTTPPPAPALRLAIKAGNSIRLYIDNKGKQTYIYRAELNGNIPSNYLRIGVTTAGVYDDHTASPRRIYEYFARVVDVDYSFADSNLVNGVMDWYYTTIADTHSMDNQVTLKHMIGAVPQKDRTYVYEKSLSYFIGREKPVLQIGSTSRKSVQLSFQCSLEDRDRIEELTRSSNTLILRDWRLGTMYGTIEGALVDKISRKDCIVTFNFTETDFAQEVEL